MKPRMNLFRYSAIGVFVMLMLCVTTAGAELTLSDVQKAIRAKGADWVAGETSVSALSLDEKAHLANAPSEPPGEPEETWTPDPELPVPIGTFDWRNRSGQNWMTPVQNQNPCGTCWDYAALGVIEAQINIDRNDPTIDADLSEQMTLSCWTGSTPWCSGGWPHYTFDQARNGGGIPDEACFPDTCKTSGCPVGGRSCNPCSDWESRAWKITSFPGVSPHTTAAYKSALQYGPLAVCFIVPDDWYFYRSGVYSPVIESPEWAELFPTGPNHCVVLVGYSDPYHDPVHPQGYWIVKNSWGSGWGTDGYGAVEYGNFEKYSYAYRVVGTTGPSPDEMPEVLFDAFNNIYVVAADLGMFGADQWAILVKADLAGSPPDIGLGFSFYHPDHHDLALHIVRDDAWLSHSWEGVWAGSGSDFVLTTSSLYMSTQALWTTPLSDAKVANDDPSLP